MTQQESLIPPPMCPHCGKRLRRNATEHKACAKKAARENDPTLPVYHRLFDHYMSEFERVRGEAPIVLPKDRMAIRRAATDLVSQVGEERTKQLITVGVERGSSIASIVHDPTRFQGMQPQWRRPAQQGRG